MRAARPPRPPPSRRAHPAELVAGGTDWVLPGPRLRQQPGRVRLDHRRARRPAASGWRGRPRSTAASARCRSSSATPSTSRTAPAPSARSTARPAHARWKSRAVRAATSGRSAWRWPTAGSSPCTAPTGVVALDAATGDRALGARHRRHPDDGHRHPAHRLRRHGAGQRPCRSAPVASTRAATAGCSTLSTPPPARSAGPSTPSTPATCGGTRR